MSDKVESNVFYKGIPEYNVHGKEIPVSNGVANPNSYTIDWTSSKLDWGVNGVVSRSLLLNSSETLSPQTPKGERWYPTQPSQIQFGLWGTTKPFLLLNFHVTFEFKLKSIHTGGYS